ncbi:MAG TPA: MmgE/PrpD family protein [Acidimicrobiales bacterium]|nr:MmgE/PrpD family protein [Acidimicrobiales bacterium]
MPESKIADDASLQLSVRAAGISFGDLPPAAVTAAKWGILDTLGVCLAATGSASEYIDPARRFVANSGSEGPVPAPTLGQRVSLFDAILWVGSLAHALDFDDVAGYSHPSAPVVCAALPLANWRKGIDGKRLITAVALGQDLVIRLAQATRRPMSAYGWLPSMPGTMGAALTAAKLLSLSAEQTRSSLGLALHQTSGTMQALTGPGSAYRAIREGMNARAGVLSALLALEGMPGDDLSLEGQYGYFPQFFGSDYEASFIRSRELMGSLISFKPWPCAGHPQLFLTALSDLMSEGKVRPGEIRTIRITGCSDLLAHQCAPLETRSAPKYSIDAKISIPFLIGKLLRHGTLTIRDFSAEGLDDPAASELGARVEWRVEPTFARGPNGYGLGRVEIEHNDGTTVVAETEYPLGHPDRPLTWDQIADKFRACVASSSLKIPDAADEIIAMVDSLEFVPDAGQIIEKAFEGV